MEIFNYDDELSFQQNYTNWRIMNEKERRQENEPMLSVAESKRTFVKMWGYKNNDWGYLNNEQL